MIILYFNFHFIGSIVRLKNWLDEVLTYGWAYGSESGYKVGNKKVALALSVDIDEQEYTTQGKYNYTLAQLLFFFEVIFSYIKFDYQ